MKALTDRTQIAKALNYGKYPVLEFDFGIEENIYRCGEDIIGFKGSKVRIPWTYQNETHYEKSQMNWFNDEQVLSIGNGGCCLTASFGYKDIEEMLEYTNAPILDKAQKFVLVLRNSKTRLAVVLMMETEDYKDIHCQRQLYGKEKIDLMAYYYTLL